MQSAIYVIDLENVSDPVMISEFLFTRVYGSSCFIRNLALLRRSFSDVSILVVGTTKLAAESREKLQRLAQQQSLSIAFGDLPFAPEDNKQSLIILYQSGLALLTRVAVLDANNMEDLTTCNSDSTSRLPDLLQTWQRITEKERSQVLLCHAFPASEGSEVDFVFYRKQDALNIAPMGPDLVKSVKRHLEVLASQRSMDGPVSRMVVRHLCHLVSKPLAAAGVHPNYVTLAGALFALFAVLLFWDGRYSCLATGGVCWLVGGILDEADGEVARLQGKESTFGSWLDLTLDRVFDAAMLLSLAWPLIPSDHGDGYLIVTLCALVAVSASSYTGLLYDNWMRSKDRHTYFRLGRDVRIAIITLSALLGLRIVPIALCGIFAATEVLRRFWVCWHVERSARRPMKMGTHSKA